NGCKFCSCGYIGCLNFANLDICGHSLYIKSLLTAEIYNYCLQEYMCRLINENVSEQEQLSL
ncbi:hypothetical protein F9960_05690, partial [Bacteroides stercoris]